MISHPSLKHTLTELYLSDPAYPVSEVLDLLRSLDYFALEDAVKERMELVFAYATKSWFPRRYNISTDSLFGQKAVLLISGQPVVCDLDNTGAVVCSRVLELWLLEDMSFAVVSHHSTVCISGMFTTDYRAIKKGTPLKCGMMIDLRILTELLKSMYMAESAAEHDEDDCPVYFVTQDETGINRFRDYIFPCDYQEELDLGD